MNPLREKFGEIEEYCTRLAAVNYDRYKFYRPVSLTDIESWEQQHCAKLPEDYRNWLMLSDGFSCSAEDFLPLAEICPCPEPDYADYFILGHYGGDGSMLLTDKHGTFFKLDHSRGLTETTFETFLDKWVAMWLRNDMMDAGLF